MEPKGDGSLQKTSLRRRWVGQLGTASSTPSTQLTVAQYEKLNPPGYLPDWDISSGASAGRVTKRGREVDAQWKEARAWEMAQAPFKSFFMMGFMMWMAGSTVHIFSIGILVSILWQPISALRSLGPTFKPFEDEKGSILGPKLVFVALNLVALGAGLWKLNSLGVLPTKAADWISQLPPRPVIELSVGGPYTS